jgi:hypothetical protein
LALCVIDAIYSISANYRTVLNVLNRYRKLRTEQGGDADQDSIDDLLRTFDGVDPESWAGLVKNRQRTSTRSGILKSEAVFQQVHILRSHGIFTTPDVHIAVLGEHLADIEADWKAVPGQKVTWGYLFILARPHPPEDGNNASGGPSGLTPTPDLLVRYAERVIGVKPDRMIIRYVANALGVAGRALPSEKAAAVVRAAALAEGWDVFSLDHTIWRYQSKRPHLRP